MEKKLTSHFQLSRDVAQAILMGSPVVALESTVITHGLPKPQNLKLALDLQEIIQAKAVPATIALLNGKIKVGLTEAELEELANSETVRKISARDISIAVSSGWDGGTTVSATMFAAHQAGIKVFATGGIGGVHRESVFDVSADLLSLSHSPLIVVCSGAKVILDLPATREQLETLGVPVIGYQTEEFPAFFSANSGLKVDFQAGDVSTIVRIAENHWKLGLKSAILVVNPPPAEANIPGELLEEWVKVSLDEAKRNSIGGAKLTPYLLQRLQVLSDGKSLDTNLALLRNNARLAAEIARDLQHDVRFRRL